MHEQTARWGRSTVSKGIKAYELHYDGDYAGNDTDNKQQQVFENANANANAFDFASDEA